jgi:hypothetical protein
MVGGEWSEPVITHAAVMEERMNSINRLSWRVHTPNLINDIIANMDRKSYEQNVMTPMVIFQSILRELAELAIEIDDPRLSLIMCRLTLFSCADKREPDYDPDIFEKLKEEIKNL